MQYYAIFTTLKYDNFRTNNCDISLIFDQYIDSCGCSLEVPHLRSLMDTHNLCFEQSCEIITFLAHLSRRLTGELIGYPWIRRPSVRRPSVVVVRLFTFSNIFSYETTWPIKAKFYVEPPWEGGTKVYINGLGHMTKMAATPI